MAVLTGTWIFNDALVLPSETLSPSVLFMSNNEEFKAMNVGSSYIDYEYASPVYEDQTATLIYEGSSDGAWHSWYNEAHKTIDFGESEQPISDDFYEWFITNATEIVPEEPDTPDISTIAEKLSYIAENEPKVYQAGYEKGKSEGGDSEGAYNEGFEAGKQAEYDAFWDRYQDNGNRTDYANAFSGRGWSESTFKPKYDMTVTNPYMLFRYCGIKDLGVAIRNSGKRLIIDNHTLSYSFNNTLLEIIDNVEFAQVLTKLDAAFNSSSLLREIRIPIPIIETTTLGAFSSCGALEEVRFNGTIGTSTLNLQWSTKLSKASIENIVSCLSTTTNGLTVTLSKTSVNKAFETSEGANDGTTSAEWLALVATRSNWTISLV